MEFPDIEIECWEFKGELRGAIAFETFDAAFRSLTKGSNTEGAFLWSPWYVDWCWIQKQNSYNEFFKCIEEELNDDCVFEIMKYLDVLHIIFFALINTRFSKIAKDKLKKIEIYPTTVGVIDLMNFRYILNWCGDSLEKLYISVDCFRSHFGCHSSDQIKHILEIILYFAGNNLKFLHLKGFHSIDNGIKNSLTRRGIDIEMKEESLPVPKLKNHENIFDKA